MIRASVVFIAVVAAVLLVLANFSNHPMAPDFISRVSFEGGYKFLCLFALYLANKGINGLRRHEMIDLCGGKGSKGHVAIYCVTMLCVCLIITFVK